MSKEHKITKICAIFLAVFIIILIADWAISLIDELTDFNTKSSFVYKYDDIKKIKIDTDASNVIIKKGDVFTLSVDNASRRIKVNENNGTLKIKDKRIVNIAKTDSVIEITVPEVLEKLDIEVGKGTLECTDIVANDLKMSLGAGKVNLNNVYFNKTDIEGGAGQITINNSTLNDLDLDAGTGKVYIDGKITGNSKIEAGIGEIEVKLIENNYRFKLDKGVGKIILNNETLADEGIYGTGDNIIQIEAGIGNIIITTNTVITTND